MAGHTREYETLNAELVRLNQEEGLIRKTLDYIRQAKQKNKVEGLEIQSKIRELSSLVLDNDSSKVEEHHNKGENTNTAIVECGPSNFDDPSQVNKTKLNLDIQHKVSGPYIEESDESE